ncbi:MAG: tripartite tricarboxylate transporter substrate binding protein [Burkholderiaceae bacterium]|nr:tripartite tricarboxylate transporter substrate binding protein [Burkholderiaceae bacterium]
MTFLPLLRPHTLLAMGVIAFAGTAFGQAYPTKPIRLVVPFAVGGTTDIVARTLAEGLTKDLGQPVVVDNKGGGGGSVGAREIMRARPDGYTIGFATVSTHGINPAVIKNLGYDVNTDFTHISMATSFPGAIFVHPSFPAKDHAGFVKAIRAAPGKFNYASSGTGGGTHISMELYKSRTGLFITHIPYRGSGPATNDVVAGQVPILWDALPSNMALVKSGQLIAIGLAAKKRSPLLPNLPTFTELGVKDYEAELWNGVVGPAGIPPAIVATLNAAVARALTRPEVIARMEQMGATVQTGSSEEFSKFIRAEVNKWTQVAKFANIVAE